MGATIGATNDSSICSFAWDHSGYPGRTGKCRRHDVPGVSARQCFKGWVNLLPVAQQTTAIPKHIATTGKHWFLVRSSIRTPFIITFFGEDGRTWVLGT